MKALEKILKANKDKKILIMPIGLSGSGKTTLYKTLSNQFDIEYISFDKIRIDEFLKENPHLKIFDKRKIYREAYKYSSEKKLKLLRIAKEKFITTDKKIVYIDNTNLTKKSRNKFLCEAKDFLKISVFFKPNPELCIKRQFLEERDKFVSPKIILQQLETLEEPDLEEFDIVIKNLVKNKSPAYSV